MSAVEFIAGQPVALPGGGTANVIAGPDVAGLVLVRFPNGTVASFPAEHLQPLTTGAPS